MRHKKYQVKVPPNRPDDPEREREREREREKERGLEV
jgi:hypothetical protein